MGRRLRTLGRIVDGVTAVWNLVAAARSNRGIAGSYFLVGLCAGFAYRALQRGYVGRFRDRPFRYALLVLCWWPVGVVLVWTMDHDAEGQSFGAGISLGSLLYAAARRA